MRNKGVKEILVNSDLSLDEGLESEKFKTTDVNILLNRVRLDKKRTLRKRIVFSIFVAAFTSSIAAYFLI